MAKLKIIWSNRAKIKLLQLLEFYAERNKSKTYSRKLFHTFNKELLVLSKQPEMGIKTDIESITKILKEMNDSKEHERVIKRKEFAASHTWENNVNEIYNSINKVLK